MLIGLLALGTVGFWVFFCVFTVLFWCLLENEKHGWASFSMLVGLAMFMWLGKVDMHSLELVPTLKLALLYVACGTVWPLIKWYFHVNSQARKYKELRNKWATGANVAEPLSENNRKKFHDDVYSASALAKRPLAKNNKSKILAWGLYWPWSFTWTMINDPVVRLFKEIFYRLEFAFDKISKHAYKDIDG